MNLVLAIGRLLTHDVVREGPSVAVSKRMPRRGTAPPASREKALLGRDDDGPGEPPGTVPPWTEWMRPQEIVLDVDVKDRNGALEIAAAYIGRAHGLAPGSILRALLRREEVGSTALGQGVAIPHARIAGLARPLTLFIRTRDPIAFNAPDGKPVSNILVIMVPADGATDDHLQLLALVAATFSDRAFRASLSAAATAAQVDAVFADWRKTA